MRFSRFPTLVWRLFGRNNSLPPDDFEFLLMAAIRVALCLSSRMDYSMSAIPSSMVGAVCRILFHPKVLMQSRFVSERMGMMALATLYSSAERSPKAFETGLNRWSSVSIGTSSNFVTRRDVSELAHVCSRITNYNRALRSEESIYRRS
jgi:hypothetical protein